MRILVTGSRKLGTPEAVYKALNYHYNRAVKMHNDANHTGNADRMVAVFTVVHGDNPSGADMYAESWVRATSQMPNLVIPVQSEPHPAQWDRKCDGKCFHGKKRSGMCPAAGPVRNQEMVDLGADLCLAFPIGRSAGTRGCMKMAEKAGIPVQSMENSVILRKTIEP